MYAENENPGYQEVSGVTADPSCQSDFTGSYLLDIHDIWKPLIFRDKLFSSTFP